MTGNPRREVWKAGNTVVSLARRGEGVQHGQGMGSVFTLQCDIALSTIQLREGFLTHPCHTPPVREKMLRGARSARRTAAVTLQRLVSVGLLFVGIVAVSLPTGVVSLPARASSAGAVSADAAPA